VCVRDEQREMVAERERVCRICEHGARLYAREEELLLFDDLYFYLRTSVNDRVRIQICMRESVGIKNQIFTIRARACFGM
jgi:hypothetical protein